MEINKPANLVNYKKTYRIEVNLEITFLMEKEKFISNRQKV